MVNPDPGLGLSSAGFDSTQVRNALLFAMQMGKPNDTTRQAKFVKKGAGRRYYLDGVEQFLPPAGALRVDRDGKPLNPNITVATDTDQEIDADCAIEITQANADEIPLGNFRPVKATVTLMQQEYERIQGARELAYNGDRYGYGYEPEANGLFDMTFHTIVFFALDES